MPDATIQSWLEDPEFQSLDVGRKQSILTNYFNSNLTDDEFYSLPDPQKVSIRDNFIQQNMPQPEPAAPESKPERSAAGYALGLAKLAGRGALEGLSTELPRMVGKGMEFVGIDAGKDLAEWSEKKAEDWFGEEPKDLDIVERSFYEGAKMLAPSIVPAGTLGTGARLALGVGKLVKGAKVAQIAGDGLKSAYLMNKASKAAKAATAIAGGGTAAIFGLSQSQETLDTANAQADALEQAGNYQEAAQVREGAMKAAFLTGGIEAAGEYLGTKYLGKLFRLDEAEVVKRGTTRLITDFFKTLGVEVSTEMGQAGGQAATEKYFAVRPEAAPMAEALNVIGPTMFMTLVSGGAGAVSNSLAGGKQPINVLDPKAEEILEQIKGIYAKPGVPLETPWPAEMQQQAEEEYWRRQVEEIQRQRAQMQNQYGGIALEEAEPEGPVIEPAVSGQGAAMRTANQLVMDEAENVPEIPMKTEEEYLKGKNLFGTLEDNQPASSPYSPEMAQRKKTALSTPLLPVGTQNFEMVENKGGRIPPSLQGAFQIMETEVANGQVERGTLGGTTEHIIGSPYPDWFRMVSDKNDKGQGWSRKEFDRILELAKSGGKMTSKQEAKFQQLLKVAEEYQNTHPDLVDTDESEAAKYEPMAYDVFVLRHAGRKNLADVTPEEADAADTAYDDYVLALRKQAEPVLSEEHIKWLKPASANTPEMEAANAREEAMPGLDAVGQEQPSGEGTLPDREGVPLPEETDRESQALGELEEKISRQDQESIADVPSAQTVTAPVKAEASKDTPQQAPGGWTESTPGGMITSNDPETGGIIDSEIKSGKWFAVPNKEGFDTIDGFDTREDAYAALQKAVKAKPPTNKKEIPGSIAKAANEAATSPENDLPEPTEAQIEAGNYQKGHLSINGLDISIESPDGSTRKGTDEDGKKWESTMVGHYGYVKGTEGRDGDQVDVFLAKDYKEDAPVFVVDQVNPKTGEFDEHKILMGYGNQLTARKGYHDNYEKGWKGLGAITTISMPEFKEWLKNGDQSVPVGKVSTTVEKPSTPVETKPLTKKEKSLQEYRDYVASLTDEQRKAAGELIVESPEAPSGQTLKIKKVLADVEKGIKAPKTDTVELVTRSLATGKEETITVKKNPAPEKPEQQKTIIPSGFSKLPGSGNYKSDFGEYLISGKPGEYRLSDESTGRVIGGTYTDLETAGKKAAQDHIERNRTPDAGRNTQEAEKQPKLTISYGSTKIAEKPGPAMPEYGSSNKLFTKDAADAARELLKARLNRLNTGLDPELVQAGIQLAGYHVEAGARSFAAYSKAMIADIGEAVRPYLRAWYEAIRYYPGFKNEGMTTPADIDAGNLTKEEKVDIINQKTEKSKPKKKEREYVDDIFRSGEATPEGQQTALFSADAGERGVGRVLPEGSGVRLRPEAADDRSGSIRGRSGRKSTGDAVQLDPTEDYRITDQDDLGKGGPKQKFNDNIAAIRILSELEGREPTAEDRKILVKYVGWGGLPQAFYRPDGSVSTGWESEAKELKNLLPKDQYEAARASTQDAHYTNKTIIDAIYSGLNRLGFTGGKVLEPSVGTGNFIGLMPGDIRKRSKVTGIELDGTTSAIAKTLYPKQNIVNSGFQEVDITEGSFDLAIGNPPFGSKKLFDPNHKDLKTFSIHNYFFAKSIKALRENGLLAMVVSNAMMDKINSQQRDWMAERAELLGAIRLPNDAFRETAGTDVTTDIIFLRKLADGEKNNGQAWSEVKNVQGPDGITYRINEYFANNPGMMLGELAPNKLQPTEIEDGFYNAIPGLVARKGEKWKEELLNNDALMVLPENVYKKGQTIEDVQKPDIIVSDPGFIKPFGYGLDDKGRAVRRLPDKNGEPVYEAVTYSDKPLEGNRLERFKGLMEIRDALRRLIREEAADISEVRMKMYRRALNETYDRFIQKFGYVSNDANGQALKDDSIDLPLIRALESNYDKGVSAAVSKSTGEKQRKPSAKKAAIFKERVRFPYKSPEKAKNAKDALAIVLREDGFVNMPRIKQFLGKPEDILSELDGLVFVDPVTGAYETADIYLSGNVKKKLSQAKAAGPRYETNAKALEKVIPEDVPPEMIAVRVGATWVPIDVYETFAGEVLKTDVDIAYSDVTGVWSVQPRRGQASEYDSPRMFAGDIFKAMLQSKDIAVYDRNDDGSRTLNKDQTTIAKAKAEEIDRAFSDWWLNDMNRRETMAQIFNDKVNTTVEGRFDGAHMIFPGMGIITPGTPRDDQLRKNQKDVVWRNILKGKGLADHVVGSGKTFAAIATGMEMKRMGLLSKPMYVVPNHLVQQWAKDFQNLYPGANVLAIGRNDFSKKNRREFLGRIATGNWDAVLLAHSSFGFIKAPFEYERTFYAEQLADYEQAIQELKAAEGGKARSVKELEKARDRLKEKLKAFGDKPKDDVVDFSELGVDGLFVDEAHEFKNLFYVTKRTRVAGLGNPEGSKKAFDMFVKTRYLLETNNDKGVFFLTGTPVSNSIAEMYTMMRYLDYDRLKEMGIRHFDQWSNMFASAVSDWEVDPSGTRYRLQSKMDFVNILGLISFYKDFADVVTNNDLRDWAKESGGVWPIPDVKGGKPELVVVERSDLQKSFMAWIVHRFDNMPSDPRLDNPLKATGEAMKASLDIRMIDPSLPDHPGSKVNVAVDNLKKIYDEFNDVKGTQLVFCDLSVPKKASSKLRDEISKLRSDIEKAEALIGFEEDAEDNYLELVAELEKYSPAELMAADSGDFSVYDDIKQKLIARGIPANEIAFIHDANTDNQKTDLFSKVRSGSVRILIGSTSKMGAGMNVQNKLVALHHLDAPWRPSDLEQREGRIVRQGNEFFDDLIKRTGERFQVRILRYSTNQTLDTRRWQVIERKARNIEQLRVGGHKWGDKIEDATEAATNAAEMKAASSGNPLILEEIRIRQDIENLESLKRGWRSQRFTHERTVSTAETFERNYPDWLDDIAADRKLLEDNPKKEKTEWEVSFDGRTFKPTGIVEAEDGDKKAEEKNALAYKLAITDLANSLRDWMSSKASGTTVLKYRGIEFDVENGEKLVYIEPDLKTQGITGNYRITLDVGDKISPEGFALRLDNVLDKALSGLDGMLSYLGSERKRHQQNAENARRALDKKFEEDEKIEALRKKHQEVLTQLQKTESAGAGQEEQDFSMWTGGRKISQANIGSPMDGAWYSQMERKLSEKLPGSGTPAQMKQTIQSWAKKGEFKAEELSWSGLESWLDQQSGKVSKQQVLDYLAENNVRVEEVERGETSPKLQDDLREYRGLLRLQDEIMGKHPKYETRPPEFQSELERIGNRLDALDNKYEGNIETYIERDTTKFSQYQMEGEKSGYRELLLTLPTDVKYEPLPIVEEGGGYMVNETIFLNREDAERAATGTAKKRAERKQVFKTGHWEEPNILAHVRFNERTGPNGEKVLFIEEVQSDWHQTGRKDGYIRSTPGVGDKFISNGVEVERLPSDTDQLPDYIFVRDGSGAEFYINKKTLETGVPNAPFKTTWPMLAMKRMVRYAAENGFDSIAWTPGDVQADRYDLSKQVSSIRWESVSSDNVRVNVTGLNRNETILDKEVPVNKVDDYIGKDLGDKIRQTISDGQYSGGFSGSGLKVGGEGMKGFYDKILPAEVNKFFNKAAWGNAKVGTIDIEIGKQSRLVAEGFFVRPVENENGEQESHVVDAEGETVSVYNNYRDAVRDALNRNKSFRGDSPVTDKAWLLPITPQMKAKALSEGMPLFKKGEDDKNLERMSIAATLVEGAMKRSGLPKTAMDKIKIELKPYIDYAKIEGTETDRQWAEIGKLTGKILGLTETDAFESVVSIALSQNLIKMEKTAYHEAFHAAARWVLHDLQYKSIMKHFKGNEEAAAEAFAEYMTDSRPAPKGIERIFEILRDFFRRLGSALRGAGFMTPEDIFGSLARGEKTDEDVRVSPRGVGLTARKEFAFNKNSTDNIGRYQVAPPRSENPDYFKKDAFSHSDGAKSDFITKESGTDGVTYTMGINAETGKQEVQSINFYRDRWTEADAREWYNKNRKKFEKGRPPDTGGPGWKKMIIDGDGGEIYYRIRESNDLSKRAKIFQPPQWIAKKFPEFKAMFDLQETRVKRRLKKLANALDQTKNLWKMKNEDYETLRSLVWSMEAHGKIKAITADKFKENEDGEYVLNDEHYEQYSEVLDKIKGLNDAVKDEYLAVRKSLDQDLATVINQMRGMEDIDESVINEFRRSVGEIHNYFPHMRYGSHYVQVIDQNGEVVYREHFNTNGAGKLKIKARIKELAKEYPNHTFDAGKIEKLPEDVFSIPIPIEALEAVMDAAIQRMPDEESRLAFREALPRAVADALQTRGWGSHLINRKNIAGYEREDIKRVLFDYKSGLYGWLTKMEAARDFSNAMQEVAPQAKKKPVLWTYMRNYSRDMLANSDAVDRATNTARAIFFAKYLGGNFKTAALNLTQNIIAGWPRLGMETGNAMGAIIHGAASDLVDIATKKKHLEGDEKRLLQEMLEEGTTQSNFLNEVRGQVSANVFSVWNKTMKVLGWPMAAAEGFNRSSLALAAFRAASSGKIINKQTLERYGMEPGIKWEYEKAKEFAEEIVADSHFVYGNENRPEMFRGGMANKWAALGYTFRTFTHNLINLWSYMLKSGGPGRRAALKSLAATMAIGGMASVPLYKTFINIMQQLTGDDPEEKLLEMIGAEDTDQLRDMIVYGFPSALGVNLGGSLGMELPGMDRVKINDSFAEIGKDLLWDIIGIPTATLEDATNAIEAMSTGQYSRALEYVLPTAAANPIKAVRMYNEGQTTLSGATVGAAGQGGTAQPNQYTEGEMIRKMLGFQPIRASKEWDLYKEAQNFIVKRQRFQSDLATKYAIAYRKDDKRAKAEVLADWKAWNEEQRELGRDWLIIGQDNLKSSITARIRGRKSPKYMRKREADMVDRMGLD